MRVIILPTQQDTRTKECPGTVRCGRDRAKTPDLRRGTNKGLSCAGGGPAEFGHRATVGFILGPSLSSFSMSAAGMRRLNSSGALAWYPG